ncbi:hypothetical protein NJT12_24710, partial [Flavobacterium sp. AC]
TKAGANTNIPVTFYSQNFNGFTYVSGDDVSFVDNNTLSNFKVDGKGLSKTGVYGTVNLNVDRTAPGDINYNLDPNKAAGDYTIATLDDITGGSQNLQQVLDTGNSAHATEILLTSGGDGFRKRTATMNSSSITFSNDTDQDRVDINSAGFTLYTGNSGDISRLAPYGLRHEYNGIRNILNYPVKPEGTYTLATLDDITGGSQGIDQVLGVGNETTKSMSFNQEGYGNNVFINSNVIQVINDKENATQVSNLDSSGVSIVTNNGQPEQTVSNIFSTHVQFTTNENGSHEVSNKGIRFYKDTGETSIEYDIPTVNTTLKFPAKAIAGDYTLATTDDFKTINGESIVGEGNINITNPTPTLSQVLDAGSYDGTGNQITLGYTPSGGKVGSNWSAYGINFRNEDLDGNTNVDSYEITISDKLLNYGVKLDKNYIGFKTDFEGIFRDSSVIMQNYEYDYSTQGRVIVQMPLVSGILATTDDIKLKSYTVNTLPTGTIGDQAYVTDATAPTYLGALAGGGSVVCPVFYNGTTWVAH